MNERQKLKVIKSENGLKITKYIKSIELVKLDEEKLNWKQKTKKYLSKLLSHNIYDSLSIRQKRVLHTIAPLWANILEHNLPGCVVITDEKGERYSLDSMDSYQCLVGETYCFGDTTCGSCHGYNISFACLNSPSMRNSLFLDHEIKLKGFLDHYYENHMQKYYDQ